MLRRVIVTSLIVVAASSVGCQLVADFEKEGAADASGGGKGNRSGNTSLAGNAAKQAAAGGATTSGASKMKATSTSSGGGVNSTASSSGGAASSDIGANGGASGVGAATVTGDVGNGGTTTVPVTSSGGSAAIDATTSTPIATNGGATSNVGTGGATSTTTVATNGGTAATTTSTATVTSTGGTSPATGGAATGGKATGGAATQPGDTTPPRVVSVSPENGTSGVPANTLITINFSEAMNKASVASALTVTGFVASELALQWNGDATAVTITPTGGFQYAAGTNQTWATAKTYTVAVEASAQDSAGNSLSPAFSSSFATLRRITESISAETILSYYTYGTSGTADCVTPLKIGGWTASSSSGSYHGFTVFNVSSLGAATAMHTIESARFFGYQGAATGDFYNGRTVQLSKLVYDEPLFNAHMNTVTADIGTLSTSATPSSVSIDVLAAFKSDFVEGNVRQLYRLQPMPIPANWTSQHWAAFDCGGFHLDVTYLIK